MFLPMLRIWLPSASNTSDWPGFSWNVFPPSDAPGRARKPRFTSAFGDWPRNAWNSFRAVAVSAPVSSRARTTRRSPAVTPFFFASAMMIFASDT